LLVNMQEERLYHSAYFSEKLKHCRTLDFQPEWDAAFFF
jgi:hypothetical protein